MLSVVTWKWKTTGRWIDYSSDHVNHLRSQVERFLGIPYRFHCITDDARGLHPSINIVPLDQMSGPVPAFSHPLQSCFKRLRLLSREAEATFGKRIMQLDLDMVVVSDISRIASRTEPFLIWKSSSTGGKFRKRNYAMNTSLILMDAGSRSDVWERFSASPNAVAIDAFNDGWTGTDQAVIGYLTRKQPPPTFGKKDGIYSFRDDEAECRHNWLGSNIKIVSFHDHFDPADPKLHDRYRWLAEAWKESGEKVSEISVNC